MPNSALDTDVQVGRVALRPGLTAGQLQRYISMLRNSIIFLLFAAFATSSSHACVPSDVQLLRSGFDGKLMDYSISDKRAGKLPKWTSSEQAIPLPLHSALEKATVWIKARNPKMDSFDPLKIVLMKAVWSGSPKDLWFYTVDFASQSGEKREYVKPSAVVLMDGSVVEPILVGKDVWQQTKCK